MANSGWTNDAITSLTIPTGATTGARVVIANPATGDAVDVYDSAGKLIAAITFNGAIESFSPSVSNEIIIQGAVIQFQVNPLTSKADIDFAAPVFPSSTPDLILTSSSTSANFGQLIVSGQSDDLSVPPTVQALERTVEGSVVVSDQRSVNNLFHADTISGTTDASGNVVFAHGAAFTPTMIYVQVHAAGPSPTFGMVDILDGSIDSTNATAHCRNFNGTVHALGAVTFWALSLG